MGYTDAVWESAVMAVLGRSERKERDGNCEPMTLPERTCAVGDAYSQERGQF